MARILLITQPTDGGVFQHVTQLSHGLRERGHEPVVAAPGGAGDVELDMVRAISPAADARAVAAAARLVRRVRPNLVHAHSSKAGAVARLARPSFPRTPLVYTPHGYAFAGWFTSDAERRRYRVAERALAPLASCVLCVCEAERRLALSVGGRTDTSVVHNGIRTPASAPVHPEVAALRERGPVIAVVTLLRPGKGIETLIDALPAIRSGHPTASVAIAGRGPDRDRLAERAAERGVEDAVRFLGETPGPMPLLGGADVFVSPSWAESFPYSVLEAMAAGLPVVATDVGGTSEAVAHGATGLVVPPRDAAALADAVAGLLGDDRRRRELGDAGRARAEGEFGVEAMIEGTLRLYRRTGGLP